MFFGTPEFAAVALEHLMESHHQIVCVVSQPDKPKGRKLVLTPTPVKVVAEKDPSIKILQPETLKNRALENALFEYDPELIAVAAYGRILPSYILDYPKFGCLNIHASLLPKLRGAAPIQWALINGDTETGISIIHMTPELDAGDIVHMVKTPITLQDTSATLFEKLSLLGAEALLYAIDELQAGRTTRTPQDHSNMSRAPMLTKKQGCIDWSQSAKSIHCLIRGLIPWPLAYSYINGKSLKILMATPFSSEQLGSNHTPGSVVAMGDTIIVACGEGFLEIQRLQLEGRRPMSAKEFMAGNKGLLQDAGFSS